MDSPIVQNALDGLPAAQLVALAQFLIAAIEYLGPILVAWATIEARRDRRLGLGYREQNEVFDFIVGKCKRAGVV